MCLDIQVGRVVDRPGQEIQVTVHKEDKE